MQDIPGEVDEPVHLYLNEEQGNLFDMQWGSISCRRLYNIECVSVLDRLFNSQENH